MKILDKLNIFLQVREKQFLLHFLLCLKLARFANACIFADKTGTLTKNEMQFERCSVNGTVYEERHGQLYPLPAENNESNFEPPVDLKSCSVILLALLN